jgi:hypothetical protein
LISAVNGIPDAIPARQGHQDGDEHGQRQHYRQVDDCAEAEQGNHSLGGQPSSRRIAEQADQLGGHQDCEKRNKHPSRSMGEFPDGCSLMNHLKAGRL